MLVAYIRINTYQKREAGCERVQRFDPVKIAKETRRVLHQLITISENWSLQTI